MTSLVRTSLSYVALAGISLLCRIGEATPPLAQPNWSTGSTGIQYHSIDPQIAAGQNQVVVTEYDEVYFYTKAGVRITNVNNDATKALLRRARSRTESR